jgi:hypothetical protein
VQGSAQRCHFALIEGLTPPYWLQRPRHVPTGAGAARCPNPALA